MNIVLIIWKAQANLLETNVFIDPAESYQIVHTYALSYVILVNVHHQTDVPKR